MDNVEPRSLPPIAFMDEALSVPAARDPGSTVAAAVAASSQAASQQPTRSSFTRPRTTDGRRARSAMRRHASSTGQLRAGPGPSARPPSGAAASTRRSAPTTAFGAFGVTTDRVDGSRSARSASVGPGQRPATAGQSSMAANGKRQQPKHGLAFAGFPETADDTTRGRDPFAVSVTNEMFENQRLREELQQLKQAFVGKLRGSNKFVSGGQFRSNKRNNGQSAAQNMRAQLVKARGDNRQLRQQLQDMQAQVCYCIWVAVVWTRVLTLLAHQLSHFQAQAAYMEQQQQIAHNMYAQLNEARTGLQEAALERSRHNQETSQLKETIGHLQAQLQEVGTTNASHL